MGHNQVYSPDLVARKGHLDIHQKKRPSRQPGLQKVWNQKNWLHALHGSQVMEGIDGEDQPKNAKVHTKRHAGSNPTRRLGAHEEAMHLRREGKKNLSMNQKLNASSLECVSSGCQ